MARTNRSDPPTLDDPELLRAWEMDFFQLCRWLEAKTPGWPRIGTSRSLRDDPVRFTQHLGLDFAPATLWDVRQKENGKLHIPVRFMGLTGPNGALPLRMTEFIRNRTRGTHDPDTPLKKGEIPMGVSAPKDSTLEAFLNIFHHRMVMYFYRAWALSRKAVDFDRKDERHFEEWISSLVGLGADVQTEEVLPRWKMLAFSGHLAAQVRHAPGLGQCLEGFFRMKVQVKTFMPHWHVLEDQDCTKLGRRGLSSQLGQGVVTGRRVMTRQIAMEIRLGPMRWWQYELFLPGGIYEKQIRIWIDLYTRKQFYWKVIPVLAKEDVPPLKLSQKSETSSPKMGCLGQSAWLLSKKKNEDAAEFFLRN